MNEQEEEEVLYNLYIHLLNLVCIAKDNFSRGETHDLFHSCVCFNQLVERKYSKFLIDWDFYFN